MNPEESNRREFLRWSGVAAAGTILAACQPITAEGVSSSSDSSDDAATVRRLLSETYGSLVMAGDAAGYSDLYSEDVLWAPPGGPDQTSKEGIQNGIQGLFDKFSFEVNPQPDEIVVLGDFAYAIGIVDGVLTPLAGGDPVPIKFRIFWLLRKEDGEWKISRQIWNKKPI